VADHSLPYAEVTRIERRFTQGSGTLVGGAVGVIALGMFGFAITEMCESTSGCGGSIALVGGGAVGGGFLGMVIGTLAFPGEESWTTVWCLLTDGKPGIEGQTPSHLPGSPQPGQAADSICCNAAGND
jgi:hypothetical protein